MKKTLAVFTTALLAFAGIAVTAEAATATDEVQGCVVDVIQHPAVEEVSHEENRYSKTTEGTDETTHTECRYRTRTITYGEVEHKYIYSNRWFVDGGVTTINGHIVSGHWQTGTLAWHAIPDSAINAVWGPGGIPSSLIGGSEASPKGTVHTSVYGDSSGSNVYYYAAVESNPSGYTDWGPWSDYSTVNPGESTATMDVDCHEVSNNDGTPDVTVYYLPGGDSSSDLTEANWTTETPGEPWTLVDTRKVVTTEAEDAWEELVYGECPTNEACETTTVADTSTDTNPAGWADYDTRATGHAEYVPTALHIWTEGATSTDKVSWAHAVSEQSIANLGTLDVDFDNAHLGDGAWNQYEPGLNIFVKLNDGSGTTGTFVSEEVYGHENIWIPGNPGNAALAAAAPHHGASGGGSSDVGTIDEWLALYPDATFVGFAFAAGSGVHIEGALHSVTVGCIEYPFDKVVVPKDPPPTLALTGSESVPWLFGALGLMLAGLVVLTVRASRSSN